MYENEKGTFVSSGIPYYPCDELEMKPSVQCYGMCVWGGVVGVTRPKQYRRTGHWGMSRQVFC